LTQATDLFPGGEKPSGDLPRSLIPRRQTHDNAIEEIGAAKIACKAPVAALPDSITINRARRGLGGSNEWFTPLHYIDTARAVLRDIDLDPATCT